jgi:drug/metabolite transporter (DMT)-like permease
LFGFGFIGIFSWLFCVFFPVRISSYGTGERIPVKANLLLLLTAVVWGFAFVAQRKGMEFVGPFLFNGMRFLLGCLVLIPMCLKESASLAAKRQEGILRGRSRMIPAVVLGIVLFLGASLQQAGMVFTTAGKAGFITGLYVVLVPVFGVILKQKVRIFTWIGVALAAMGLYLLSVTGRFVISKGDFLILAAAFLWACHVQIVGYYSGKIRPVFLALVQFGVCSILSFTASALVETNTVQGLRQAALPLAYGGLISVGVGYTLQIVAQQWAHPTHAALVLSLESPAAALGGWVVLGETLSLKGWIGCAMMFCGMIFSQIGNPVHEKTDDTI